MKVEELDAEGKKEGQERERGKGERSEQEVSYIIHVVMEQLLRSLDDSFFAVYAPLFSPSLSCLLPYPTSDSLYLSSPFLLLPPPFLQLQSTSPIPYPINFVTGSS